MPHFERKLISLCVTLLIHLLNTPHVQFICIFYINLMKFTGSNVELQLLIKKASIWCIYMLQVMLLIQVLEFYALPWFILLILPNFNFYLIWLKVYFEVSRAKGNEESYPNKHVINLIILLQCLDMVQLAGSKLQLAGSKNVGFFTGSRPCEERTEKFCIAYALINDQSNHSLTTIHYYFPHENGPG